MHSTVQGSWLPQSTFPPALAAAAGGEGWEGGFSISLWVKAKVTFAHLAKNWAQFCPVAVVATVEERHCAAISCDHPFCLREKRKLFSFFINTDITMVADSLFQGITRN